MHGHTNVKIRIQFHYILPYFKIFLTCCLEDGLIRLKRVVISE